MIKDPVTSLYSYIITKVQINLHIVETFHATSLREQPIIILWNGRIIRSAHDPLGENLLRHFRYAVQDVRDYSLRS